MTKENKYTGEVPLTVGDKTGTLVYNWDALGAVEAKFDKDKLENLNLLKTSELAEIAEIGFSELSPEMTAETFKTAKPSPAKYDVAIAIDRALLYAYHGPEQATAILKRIEEAEAQFDEVDKAKKKAKKSTKQK